MFKTKNVLSEENRIVIVELLNARLADCMDLQSQAKYAHWNVKGPNFAQLHELFGDLSEGLDDYADDIAERAVQLGGIAEGIVRVVAQRSTVPEYVPKAQDGPSQVDALSSALASFGKGARKAIEEANVQGDLITADLFTEVWRGVDKWLWLVEAHSQADE